MLAINPQYSGDIPRFAWQGRILAIVQAFNAVMDGYGIPGLVGVLAALGRLSNRVVTLLWLWAVGALSLLWGLLHRAPSALGDGDQELPKVSSHSYQLHPCILLTLHRHLRKAQYAESPSTVSQADPLRPHPRRVGAGAPSPLAPKGL